MNQDAQLKTLSNFVEKIKSKYNMIADEIIDLETAVMDSEQSSPIKGLVRFPAHLQELYSGLNSIKRIIEQADEFYLSENITPIVTLPDDIDNLIQFADWKFARTYPGLPHEYTTFAPDKTLLSSRRHLVEFEKYITDHGYDETHWGKTWRYLNVGEYKYWTFPEMGLINRTLIDDAQINQIKKYFSEPSHLVKNASGKDCAPYGFNLKTLSQRQ